MSAAICQGSVLDVLAALQPARTNKESLRHKSLHPCACRVRTYHTSHITHHTSHITHHTSHITHHTSHKMPCAMQCNAAQTEQPRANFALKRNAASSRTSRCISPRHTFLGQAPLSRLISLSVVSSRPSTADWPWLHFQFLAL